MPKISFYECEKLNYNRNVDPQDTHMSNIKQKKAKVNPQLTFAKKRNMFSQESPL